MALFEKKNPYDKLKEMFNSLSDEEKSKFKAEIQDIDKAEDEREIDKIEEEKTDEPKVMEEKAEEVNEESKEIGKDIDKAEDMEEPKVEEEPVETETSVEEVEEQPMEEPVETVETEERHEDILSGIDARLKALEEKFATIETPTENIGVSGFGRSTKENINEDNRTNDVIKKLGGYAQ